MALLDVDEKKLKQAITWYQNPDKARKDALQIIKHYRGLQPKVDQFVFNDGSKKELLNLEGTVPVKYKGNTYNIPICIWLLDNHPLSAPMVYVKPTQDMLIKASRHVDQSGKVYLPYLHEWNPNSSDVMGLIQILIMTFAEMPPVYTKPKAQSTSPAHYPTPYPTQPPPNTSFMPMPSSSSLGYPPVPPQTSSGTPVFQYPTSVAPYPTGPMPYPPYPTSSSGGMPGHGAPPPPYPLAPGLTPYPPYPPATTSDSTQGAPVPPPSGGIVAASNMNTITEEHIKASLISAVRDKLRVKLREVYGGAQAELSVLRQQQNDLLQGQKKLEGLISRLTLEQAEIEKNVRILKEREAEMKSIVDKASEDSEKLDIDEAVTTTAPLYKQLLSAYAEDQSIQDAIYYLGEALRKDVVDLDTYLKHVRSLSRKQFQLRAIMNKCRGKANLAG